MTSPISKLAITAYLGKTATGNIPNGGGGGGYRLWRIDYSDVWGGYVIVGSSDGVTFNSVCGYAPRYLDGDYKCYDGNGRTYQLTPIGVQVVVTNVSTATFGVAVWD